jgi:hypothetical protein
MTQALITILIRKNFEPFNPSVYVLNKDTLFRKFVINTLFFGCQFALFALLYGNYAVCMKFKYSQKAAVRQKLDFVTRATVCLFEKLEIMGASFVLRDCQNFIACGVGKNQSLDRMLLFLS